MPDQSFDLLPLAAATPRAKGPIEALARLAPPEQFVEALERALERRDVHAATILAMATGVAGGRIPAPLVVRLAPDVDHIGYLLPLAGLVEGDRLAALLDLVATDRLSWEREAMLLYAAVRLLDGAEPPARLIARLRSLLREPLSPQAALIADMSVATLDHPEVNAVAGERARAAGKMVNQGKSGAALWQLFDGPTVDALPVEAEEVFSGFTVVRSEPKVGRNDPCPCGSGRKYKKCCAGKEQAAPVPRSLVEQFQDLGSRAPRVQQQLFDKMRPADLERLDTNPLTALQLIEGSRQLALHHRWDAAERFVEALATRKDLPLESTPEDHRLELAETALMSGQLDVAERQMALANPDERVQRVFSVRLALARKAPDAFDRLEDVLREGHADDPKILIDCAFTLLRYAPALGILVARGAMSADRLLDAEELLDAIGRARDTLALPAEEPWEEVLELLLERRSGEVAVVDGDEDQERRETEIDGLRSGLRAAADRARQLGEELSRRERELELVSGERQKLAAAVEAQQDRDERRRVAELEEERQRLRTKIAELKGEVAEGAAQRADLRRELARSADERSRIAAAVARDAQDVPAADEAEGEAVGSWPRHVLIPQFSTAASRSLADAPARVAADALQAAARLGGGDSNTWSGAKHMHRVQDVLSVRVGRPWRLLFRVGEDRLEILDLVPRRDLDHAIARLSRR
jgi:hypothetical protein